MKGIAGAAKQSTNVFVCHEWRWRGLVN